MLNWMVARGAPLAMVSGDALSGLASICTAGMLACRLYLLAFIWRLMISNEINKSYFIWK